MASIAPLPIESDVIEAGGKLARPWFDWLNKLKRRVDPILTGTGTPAGVVVANRGTVFLRTDGAAGSTVYYKGGNDGTANGWVALP